MSASRILALSALLILFQVSVCAQDAEIAGIRVHGNYRTADAEIVRLSGLEVGGSADTASLEAARKRLLSTGKFESVDIRVRHRSLSASGPAVLIIVVVEKEALANKFQALPILEYTDDYGFTYGAQIAAIDLLGAGERISVPVSWGGKKRIALEVGTTRLAPVISSLTFSVGRIRRENPYFEIDEARTELHVSATNRPAAADWLVLWGRAGFSDVEFGAEEDSFTSYELGAAVDTRQSATNPYDAVYIACSWQRYDLDSGSTPDIARFDLRGYKRLLGRTVLAGHAEWRLASEPLAPFLQPLPGENATLRGYETGQFIGDNRFIGSVELRTTLSPPVELYHAGVHFFYDAVKVWDDGFGFSDAEFHESAGVGAFIFAAGLGLVVDVAHDLEDRTRIHVGSGFRF